MGTERQPADDRGRKRPLGRLSFWWFGGREEVEVLPGSG